MKQLKYLLLFLFVAAASCTKDNATSDNPVPGALREALLNATEIGVYQDGQKEFIFDKTTQQLYINPAQHTFRIQDDTGAQYAELRLSQMPTIDNKVKATLVNTVGLKVTALGQVILLKSENQRLWLWCDETYTGFIVPWIAE